MAWRFSTVVAAAVVAGCLIFNYSNQFRFWFAALCPVLLLFFLLVLLFLPRRAPCFHAFDGGHDLAQTLIRQLPEDRKPGAQQLALLHGHAEPKAPLLERADQLVIGVRHGEAVANDLARLRMALLPRAGRLSRRRRRCDIGAEAGRCHQAPRRARNRHKTGTIYYIYDLCNGN